MPAQTMKAFHVNLLPFRATKVFAMATFLDQNSPVFSYRNFFISGVNATICIEIRAPVVE